MKKLINDLKPGDLVDIELGTNPHVTRTEKIEKITIYHSMTDDTIMITTDKSLISLTRNDIERGLHWSITIPGWASEFSFALFRADPDTYGAIIVKE